MKKKIVFFLGVMMICASLTACGSNKDQNKDSSSSGITSSDSSKNDVSSLPDSSKNDSSSSSGDSSSDSSSSAGTVSQPEQNQTDNSGQQTNQNQTQTPSNNQTQKPAQNPNNNQTQTPSKPQTTPPQNESKPQTPAKSPAVSDIASAIDKAIGVDDNYMTLSADDVSLNYGLGTSSMDSFVGKMPLMNVKATEYLVVKAADGQVDTVKDGMKKRQADLDAQWKQYLPEQYELVKNYKLVSNGNYVLFVIAENADAAVDAFNSMTK